MPRRRMHMTSLSTYEDALLVGASEFAACVAYKRAHPALVLLICAGTLAGLVLRLRGETETSHFFPSRNLALLVYGVWCFWLAWGAVLGNLDVFPRWFDALYSMGMILVSVNVARTERAHFEKRDQRAQIVVAGLAALALLPVNPAHTASLPGLILQSLMHCAMSFVYFWRSMIAQFPGNNMLFFAASTWVLCASLPISLLFATGLSALRAHEIWTDERNKAAKEEPRKDPEAPPPAPPQRAVAAQPTELGFKRIAQQVLAERNSAKSDAFTQALEQPPVVAQKSRFNFDVFTTLEED